MTTGSDQQSSSTSLQKGDVLPLILPRLKSTLRGFVIGISIGCIATQTALHAGTIGKIPTDGRLMLGAAYIATFVEIFAFILSFCFCLGKTKIWIGEMIADTLASIFLIAAGANTIHTCNNGGYGYCRVAAWSSVMYLELIGGLICCVVFLLSVLKK
jgi:hypothetical protein